MPVRPRPAVALDAQVALRPEPFGALAYHFGTRRLSFLKTRKLLAVVEGLGEHPSGRAACVAAGVTDGRAARLRAGAGDARGSGMIARASARMTAAAPASAVWSTTSSAGSTRRSASPGS